jgi:hypothetical protein
VTRRWQLVSIGAPTALRAVLAAAGIGLVLVAPARAQVSSEGKGTLTLELARGSAPVGGIASQVANPGTDVPHSTEHGNGFRLMAGYHFAEQFSVEVGLSYFGSMNSHAAYAGTDVLNAQATLIVVEGDLVATIPIAPRARIDFDAGVTDSGLHTTASTQNGTALPIGESGDDNVHRIGATAGASFEWRLGDVSSLIIGYHAYARVGSSRLRDSVSGTATGLFAGVHFEF